MVLRPIKSLFLIPLLLVTPSIVIWLKNTDNLQLEGSTSDMNYKNHKSASCWAQLCCIQTQKHLWLQMYLWVHLRAEVGEEDHFVPPSELVLLPAGHPQHLIPEHHPADENGSGETEGLAQDAVCRKEGTVEPSEWALDHLHPGAICRGTDVYGDQLMQKEPGKGQTFILPVAVFHIPASHHKELR